MSARGVSREAERWPASTNRARFQTGHVEFRINSHSSYGVTFALRTAEGPESRPDLFSGHVTHGMADELRLLADYIDRVTGGCDGQ